jgi:hypothetical protein
LFQVIEFFFWFMTTLILLIGMLNLLVIIIIQMVIHIEYQVMLQLVVDIVIINLWVKEIVDYSYLEFCNYKLL